MSSLQEITFLFGQPVAGNPAQYLFEKAFAAAGLDWRYLTLEVAPERLGDAIRGARAMNFRGGNITTPHKLAVIEHLDGLSEAAKLMQAVNCITNRDGRLIGDNTDGKGFLESLRSVLDPSGKRVVVLGAGGTARAIAVELALAWVADITIVNRSVEHGQALATLIGEKLPVPQQISAQYVEWIKDYEVPVGTDVLINATPIGQYDPEARVPVKLDSLRPPLVVADVVFSPADTRLLREAKSRGCTIVDGLGMLVNQAVTDFRLWTGITPDAALMREALEEFVSM